MSAFLIWSNQHGMWWAPHERGYTEWIEEAGRYSRERAEKIVDGATLSGKLAHVVTGRHGQAMTVLDEVLVLAPECIPEEQP